MAIPSSGNKPNSQKQMINTSASMSAPQPTPKPEQQNRSTSFDQFQQANQQAGTRIANTLQQGINRGLDTQKIQSQREIDEAQKANQQFGQLNQQGQQFTQQLTAQPQGYTNQNYKIQTGLYNTSQRDSADVNEYRTKVANQQAAQDIVQDQQKLEQFRNIATGQSQKQAQEKSQTEIEQSAQQAVRAQQELAERQRQLANNRYSLLKEFIGSRGYTSGQQKLDQAFLSTDKNRTLDQVKQQVQARNPEFKQFSELTQAEQKALSEGDQSLVEQGKRVASESQGAADSLVNTLLSGIDARIPQLQTARQKELDYLQDQFNKLKANEQVSSYFGDYLNADTGSQLFNALKGLDQVDNIIDVNELRRAVNTRKDVTNQGDIDTYNLLAKLAGKTDTLQKSDLGVAKGKTGEGSLADRIAKATNEAAERAAATNIYDYAKRGYGSSGLFNKRREVTAQAQLNLLNDVLKGKVTGPVMKELGGAMRADDTSLAANISRIENQISPLARVALGTLGGPVGGVLAGAGIGNVLSGVQDFVDNLSGLGAGGDSKAKATQLAYQDLAYKLQQQIDPILKDLGYYDQAGKINRVQIGKINPIKTGFEGETITQPTGTRDGRTATPLVPMKNFEVE